MKLFKKYEFDSKEQAETKIAALPHIIDELTGESYLEANHTIVHLGFLIINTPEYDDNGDEVVAPVYSDKYSVDVLWDGLSESPYGWKTYEITVEGNGVHTFAGLNFNS